MSLLPLNPMTDGKKKGYVRMKDGSTVKAPKDEIEGVLEVIVE